MWYLPIWNPRDPYMDHQRKKLIYEEATPHTAMKFCMELEEIKPLDSKGFICEAPPPKN